MNLYVYYIYILFPAAIMLLCDYDQEALGTFSVHLYYKNKMYSLEIVTYLPLKCTIAKQLLNS